MSNSFDVAVVGAGPAGSIAALSLARAGVSVALLERRKFPRDKVCGDVLTREAIDLLREYELWEAAQSRGHGIDGARLYGPDGTWVDLDGTFHAIPRVELDAFLVERAVEAGATLIPGAEATDFESGAAVRSAIGGGNGDASKGDPIEEMAVGTSDFATLGYVENGVRRELRVRLTILACGARTKTLRRFGVLLHEAPSAFAMRAYYRLSEDVDDSRLYFLLERPVLPGYGWIFPMGDGLFNVGVGIHWDGSGRQRNLRHILKEFLSQCEAPRELLSGGTELTPFKGAPLRMGLTGSRPSADRLLVCGESVGATYHLTGEGIGKGMEVARVAADHALTALGTGKATANDLSGYDDHLERLFRERFESYRTGQRWLAREAIANLVVRRCRNSPRARGLLEGILADTERPTELLSMWGILKALVLK